MDSRSSASFSALMLDFDGTVCATETPAYLSWVDLYRSFGINFPSGLWRQMRGRADGEEVGLQALQSSLGRELSAAEVSRRRQRKRQLADAAPTRTGIRELIQDVVRSSLTLALVSNSSRAWVHHHIRRLDLGDVFDVVLCREHVANPKPAPDLYFTALSLLRVESGAALAVEDSGPGFDAATCAGVKCVLFPEETPFGDRDAEAEACLRVVSHVRQCLTL